MTQLTKLFNVQLKKFAELLGITDYKINVEFSQSNKNIDAKNDEYASVIVEDESRQAYIDVNKNLLRRHPDELTSTVVHELLHIRFSELLSLMDFILDTYVKDRKARKTYKRQLELLEHKIIVGLSNTLDKLEKKNG